MSSNWRTEVDAEDYFGHQKKKLDIADRRPLIRRASDLVGPGIAPHATPFTDFNDSLVTFNGFFSNRTFATNAPPGGGLFFGFVVSDAVAGGFQHFTNIFTSQPWVRQFSRNESNPDQIQWGPWETPYDDRPAMVRKNPSASSVNTTTGTAAVNLTLPTRLTVGRSGTFGQPNTHSISILRPGIYSGSVVVTSWGDHDIDVYTPSSGTASTLNFSYSVPNTVTATIPVDFDVTSGGENRVVRLAGKVRSGSGTNAGVLAVQQFSLSRIGPR